MVICLLILVVVVFTMFVIACGGALGIGLWVWDYVVCVVTWTLITVISCWGGVYYA